MNKKLILLFMFISSLALGFTACSDDDDEETPTDYAKEVAGTYNGTLTLNIPALGVADEEISDKNIVLARKSDNVINLTLKDFSFDSFELGDIAVEDIAVSKSGETVKLADKTVTLTLQEGMTAKVAISGGTISKDNVLDIDIAVSDVIIGGENAQLGTMAIEYSGTKK